ncbi:hypothetical protein V8C42DRAFT_332753 [Trichoderma barbatum]
MLLNLAFLCGPLTFYPCAWGALHTRTWQACSSCCPSFGVCEVYISHTVRFLSSLASCFSRCIIWKYELLLRLLLSAPCTKS